MAVNYCVLMRSFVTHIRFLLFYQRFRLVASCLVTVDNYADVELKLINKIPINLNVRAVVKGQTDVSCFVEESLISRIF